MGNNNNSASIELSFVLPTLNEGRNLEIILPQIHQQAKLLEVPYEIVVIDGGSTDHTVEIAKKHGAIVFLQSSSGFAQAVRDGLSKAQGKYIITLDADGSHSPDLISRFWAERQNIGLVIASRYLPGSSFKSPFYRRLLSYFLNSVFAKALSVPAQDLSSGYRLYLKEAVDLSKCTAQNYSIQQELLIRILNRGYAIKEIPLSYEPRITGHSHARVFGFLWSYIVTLHKLWAYRNLASSADYDHRAFDSIIPIQRYWQRKRFRIITDFLGANANDKSILDIGCGSSRIVQHYKNAVAFDLSWSKLRFLKSTNPYRVHGTTFDLPFADGAFDIVIHSEVLEHVKFDDKIFSELNRVLKPGGTLIVGTPDYGRLAWNIAEFFCQLMLTNAYTDEHITHYDKEMLTNILTRHGFSYQSHHYILGGELIMHYTKN